MSDFEMFLRAWRRQLPPRFSSVVDAYIRRHQAEMSKQLTQAIARAAKKTNWIGTPHEQVATVEADPDEQTNRTREAANLAAMKIAATKDPASMSPADRKAIMKYSGWGGLSIERYKGQFPRGMEPEDWGLAHEYYTPTIVCESIARRICPLLPSIAGLDGNIRAVEPSVGIGRMVRALSSPTCPAGDNIAWMTVEYSAVSSKLWQAVRPDVRHYQMAFEKFIADFGDKIRGRTNLIIANPPYGARGEFAALDPDKSYREKKAYAYFLRRGLELLTPGGLGVYLVSAAFLSGPSNRALRERLLRRFHLAAAFRLPSNYPNANGGAGRPLFPGAQVVVDVIFWRARGGELPEVDEADRFIVDGRYFALNPTHVLGTETQSFEEAGGKLNPYKVIGTFTGLPALEERPGCATCSIGAPQPIDMDQEVDVDLPHALASAVALGMRVGNYLALRAADDETAVQLWPELHGALVDFQKTLDKFDGNPWKWMELRDLQRRRIRGAEQILNAFDKNGDLVQALANMPKYEPKYQGSPDDVLSQANMLFRQQRSLTTDQLMAYHRSLGGQRTGAEVLGALMAADWNLDGEAWDQLMPLSVYTTGCELWDRYDRAKKRADEGDAQALKQTRRLLDAIKPVVFEDITDISPQHGYVPLSLVSEWASARFGSKVSLERTGGIVHLVGHQYNAKAMASVAPKAVDFIGWMNHDDGYFRPERDRDEISGELRPMAQQRVITAKEWNKEFREWVAADPERRARLADAYNRGNRGCIVPAYSSEPLEMARWGASAPKLRPHQAAGARRVLDVRGGLLAFDVGVGKTYTALAIIARARQEGWVRRPVILAPGTIVWKWYDDIRCTLPDYRVEVIGSNRKIMQRGPRKGMLTSETDSAEERAAKWVRFQNGELDVVILSYDMLDRTMLSDAAIEAYAGHIEAVERSIALRQRNLKKKKEKQLTEREKALLKHGTTAWVREIIELSPGEKYDPGIFWDQLGIDMFIIDEAQNFKNLHMPQPRAGNVPKFMGAAGEGSDRAWQVDFRAAAVRRNTGGAGVVLLSATPAKNSPLEFYNLVQFVDPHAFYKAGIYDPEQFIERFLEITVTDVPDPTSFNITQESAVTGFKNLDDLRTLLFTYGEFRTAEEVGLRLPCPIVERITVTMDDRQEAKYSVSSTEFEKQLEADEEAEKAGIKASEGESTDEEPEDEAEVTEDEDEEEKPKKKRMSANAMLAQMARLFLIAIHADLDEGYDFQTALEGGMARRKIGMNAWPYYEKRGWDVAEVPQKRKKKSDDDEGSSKKDQELWIEKMLPKPMSYSSPKFEECAKRVAAARGCGHIIFCEPVAAHQWIREVLVQHGIPRERIAIMNAEVGGGSDRVRIANEFNGLSSEPLPAGSCKGSKSLQVEPKYDVVIANSVAYEGIDLQVRTCSIHHIDLPWTPSDLQQRNGRAVRQGNQLAVVNIFYYYADSSADGYRFATIDGKANWLSQILTSQVRDTNNPGAQQNMSREDMMLMVSRNKAKTEALIEKRRLKAIEEERKRISSDAAWTLRQASGRFRDARESRDPERAAILRKEGEVRLTELTRIDPAAWPWAPWITAVRDTEVLLSENGGPVYEGLRIRTVEDGDVDYLEFGQIKGDEIGVRRAGTSRWDFKDPEAMGLTPDMYPQADAWQWPSNDDAMTEQDIQDVLERRGYNNFRIEDLRWRAASNAFLDHWWPKFATQIGEAMYRSYYTGTTGKKPIVVESADGPRLQLVDRYEIPDGKLLPPSISGWRRYLELAPATEFKFTELKEVGQSWWERSIPQDLLSKNRPKKGGDNLIEAAKEMGESLPRIDDMVKIEKILRDAQVPFVSTCPGKYVSRLPSDSSVLYLAPAPEAVAELRGEAALAERAQAAIFAQGSYQVQQMSETQPILHVRLVIHGSGEGMPRRRKALVESLPVRQIERLTRENKHFRRVLDTTPHLQVVLMTIPKGEEIGEEVHHGHDQFFRIEEGKAVAVIDGKRRVLHDGDAILVPQGTRHNVINAGKGPLKLYTLYAPPRHMPGTVQHTRPRGESLPTPPPSRRLVDSLIDEAEKVAAAEGHPETVVVDLRDRPDLRTLAIQSASEAGWSIQPTDTGMILKDMHPQLVTSDPDSRLDRAARFYATRYDLSAERVRGDRALLERAVGWYDLNEQDLKNVRSAKDVRDLELLVEKPPPHSESCPSTGERTPTVEVEPGGVLMRLDPSEMPMEKIGKMIDKIAAEEYGETPERDYSESYSRSRDGSRFYDTGWTNLRSIIDYMSRGRERLVDLAGALESADFAVMIAGDDDCRESQSDSPVIWLYPGKAEPVFAILRGDQRSICKLAYVFTDLGYTVHQSTRPSYSRLEIERRPPEEGLPRRGPRQSKIVHRFGAPGRPYNDFDTRLAALHPENTHRAIERTTQEMIREYSRMLAEDPDNAAVRLERAEAWLDLGSPGLARMDIQMVLDSQVPGEIRRRAKGLVLRLEQGESLPASVKMPAKARRMWEHVYESQLERGVQKDRAAASAWSQVKKYYVKQPSGRWVSRTDA